MSDFLNISKKNVKGGSLSQEKRLEKSWKAKRTPASGALAIKGDLRSSSEIIEAKTTSKTQYTLKMTDLLKLEEQARGSNARPVFVINLANDSDVPLLNKEWVLIPETDYRQLRSLIPHLAEIEKFLSEREEKE